MTATTDLSLRLRRAEFNKALAACDLDSIRALLAPDVILVTGTDSAVITGRNAQLQAWRREFAAAARVVYVRTPQVVIGSDVEPIAFEHGKWQGSLISNGDVIACGDYTAKWRQKSGQWFLEAEIFLTLGLSNP